MSKFRRCSTMFIAALGDPAASSGIGAQNWGLWPLDPGPRGVRLSEFNTLSSIGVAKAGWSFDSKDFWIEEHGLLMEAPIVPMVPATSQADQKFVVTGDREVTTILTVSPTGEWKLDEGTLYDVTHLPCRSGRYTCTPASTCDGDADGGGGLALTTQDLKQFPVRPGAAMPPLPRCTTTDYAVLFVTQVEDV